MMKRFICLVVGMAVAAGTASAAAELPRVPFSIGKQQFKPGDEIVIDEVLATSPDFGVGDRVLVRGHYRLASAAAATLGLFVTHLHAEPMSHPTGDSVSDSQTARAEGATGTFELSCAIAYPGTVHVSFYPASGGDSFGGVYFAGRDGAARPAPDAETIYCVYHAKPGREAACADLLAKTWSLYRRLDLVLAKPHVVVRGSDEAGKPYFVEILTWRDAAIPDHAPAEVRAVWKELQGVCEPRGGRPGIDFSDGGVTVIESD
jgi:hypothetical protein